MRDLFSSKLWVRAGAVYLVVAIFFAGIPSSVFAAPIVDIKVNDSDGPVMVSGEEFVYSWTSTEATACTLTSPTGVSGISLAGVGAPIPSGHPWYPTLSNPTTLTFDCTDGTNNSTDTVVINLVSPPPPPPDQVTADIKVNDSDGPVVVDGTESYIYSWNSTFATACTLTSPTGVS